MLLQFNTNAGAVVVTDPHHCIVGPPRNEQLVDCRKGPLPTKNKMTKYMSIFNYTKVQLPHLFVGWLIV